MNKTSISIGTKVSVKVRDKQGTFNENTSPTAQATVVFVSPHSDFVVVELAGYRTSYWCEDISPVAA